MRDFFYNSKYKIGQIVYLITDVEQSERMITGVLFRDSGVMYQTVKGADDSWHYEFEITREKDVLKQIS